MHEQKLKQTVISIQITDLCCSSHFSQQIEQTVLLAGVQYLFTRFIRKSLNAEKSFSAIYRTSAVKTKRTLHDLACLHR